MNRQRQQYLKAMGIQFWQRRDAAPSRSDSPPALDDIAPPPVDEPAGPSSTVAVDTATTPDPAVSSPADDKPPLRPEIASPERLSTSVDAGPPAPPRPSRVIQIAAMDWEDLTAEVRGCTACGLHAGRKQAVFGVGNRQASWMIVGEAPGADEDRLGEPFVGRSGKLLDLMLQALSLDRQTVFIANVIKCRPPQNRDPTTEESFCCRPFLERQVALVKPRIILAVGRVAAQNLLDTQQPVGKLRNRVHRFGTPAVPLVVTYHPAYLLRSPREKRKAWQDLQLAHRALRDGAPAPAGND